MCVQIPRRLGCQTEFCDIIIHPVRDVAFPQKEIGGHVKGLGDAIEIIIAQLFGFTADETADQAFRTAGSGGKLGLGDLSGLEQILQTVADFSGKIYLIHIEAPLYVGRYCYDPL